MKTSTLPILRCTVCGSNLTYGGPSAKGAIADGELICCANGHTFPVRDGALQMIQPGDLSGLNRKYAALYSMIAPFYDSQFFIASYIRGQFWPSGERKARREIIDHLEIKPGDRILETGIGTGANVPYLRRKAGPLEIFGLDISPGMLRQCRRREAEVELFMAPAETLPFRDEIFDVVFHIGGINAFSDKKSAIMEMIRVARSETRIVVADETEEVANESGLLGRLGLRLYLGRRLTSEILDFHVEELLDTLPEEVEEVQQQAIWDGNGYLLSFRKA